MSTYMEVPHVRAQEVRRYELFEEAHLQRLASQASHDKPNRYGSKGFWAILSRIAHLTVQIRVCDRFTPGATMLVRRRMSNAALLLEG